VSVRVSASLVPAGALPSSTAAVVIDVLRATTTLSVALANGAARVLPATSPEAAAERRRRRPRALLCGERGGLKLPGFDLGNSPFEYDAAAVRGRDLIFASTNGSLALIAARSARRRVLAAFVNASAVLETLAGDDDVTFVCAGALGRPCLEDLGCAGWLAAGLARRGARLDAAARALAALAPRDAAAVRTLVQGASHARDLRALGPAYAADVEFCARLDTLSAAFEV